MSRSNFAGSGAISGPGTETRVSVRNPPARLHRDQRLDQQSGQQDGYGHQHAPAQHHAGDGQQHGIGQRSPQEAFLQRAGTLAASAV